MCLTFEPVDCSSHAFLNLLVFSVNVYFVGLALSNCRVISGIDDLGSISSDAAIMMCSTYLLDGLFRHSLVYSMISVKVQNLMDRRAASIVFQVYRAVVRIYTIHTCHTMCATWPSTGLANNQRDATSW